MTESRYVSPETVEKARKVDLFSYLKSTSPMELVPCGGQEFCTREHDSLKISNGKWYWWSHGIGGASALDYLIKVKGLDFISAVKAVVNEEKIPLDVPVSEKKVKKIYLPSYTFECKKVRDYLTNRGIDSEILDDFIREKHIAESIMTGSALFFGRDDDGKIRQCSERATDGTTTKKDSYGSDRSYFFLSKAEKECPSVSVFESAIDLLSFATLFKMRGIDYKKFNLMSLSGIYFPAKDETKVKIPTSLGRFLDEHKETKTVYLHLDSDYAGQRGAEGIVKFLKDKYDVKYYPPKFGKDFNDYLMHIKHMERLKENNERNEKVCREHDGKVHDGSRT